MRNKKGFTLIELILVISIMMMIFAIIIPQKHGIEGDLLLYQTVTEIENMLKLARHLSIDESTTYRMDVNGKNITIRKFLYNTEPVYTLQVPEDIDVRITTFNVVYFNRNGASGYNRIVVENRKSERFILETGIGTGRIKISR